MKTPHPHATFLRAIADGEPIENFQIRCKGYDWREMYAGGSALFGDNECEIRRKPRTIRIGNTEVQAGITEAPEDGMTVWIADQTIRHYASAFVWEGSDSNAIMLRRGLVHLTKEPAAAMGRALAALTEHRE